MLETSLLQSLVAVAKNKSFSRAGEVLGVTQSAVSQNIKNLEKKLQVTLFERKGKELSLTSEGERLYTFAGPFLHKMEETLKSLRWPKQEMIGKVVVGTLDGIGKNFLAMDLMDIIQQYPKIEVEIILSRPEKIKDLFDRGEIDVALLPENFLPIQGKQFEFGRESINLVIPKEYRKQLKENLTLNELLHFPLIAFDQDNLLFHTWYQRNFHESPKHLWTKITVNSHANILYAVSKGLGMAVLPTHVLHRSYYKDQVEILSAEYEVKYQKYFLVVRPEFLQFKRIEVVIDALLSKIKNHLNDEKFFS